MKYLKLTTKAKILLWFCGFIPYRYHSTSKRRKTFQWPIEKVVWVINTLRNERDITKYRINLIKSKYVVGVMIIPPHLELQYIYLLNIESQLRGYTRLALKKGWIKK